MAAPAPEGNSQYRFCIIYLRHQAIFKDFGGRPYRYVVFPRFPDAFSDAADGGIEQFGKFMFRHTYLTARHADGHILKIEEIPVFLLFLLPLECTCSNTFV